jgi:hypothetical protein
MSLLDAAGVVTGDIWCTGAFSFESPLKDLLDSQEYTLEQLLAEDELLQELRGIHPQLIEFFSTEEAVTGLMQYVILPLGAQPPKPLMQEPSPAAEKDETAVEDQQETSAAAEESNEQETDEKEPGKWLEGEQPQENNSEANQNEQGEKDMLYVRFPYMACEVICCEINGIVDTIVDGFVSTSEPVETEVSTPEAEQVGAEVTLKQRPKTILDLLFSMLYDAGPGEVDDYRAGYFDKLLSVLFRKRPQAMSQYVNEGGGRGNVTLMKAMFKHLYSHSIMQIVQRLLLPQPPLPLRDEDDDEEGEQLYADAMEGADLDGMGAFRCNWSESSVALELLLDCLIGSTSLQTELEGDEERYLSLCQNASEVLITIIQNSPLTSPTLNTLTTDPIMEKLIIAGSAIADGQEFSPHDSKLTCTMNVLESLILQLGGYGSVGTVMMPEDEEGEEGDEGQQEGVEVQDGEEAALSRPLRQQEVYATSDTLIKHLSVMLSNLCKLLLHPSADKWVSLMQFSKTEPQKLLGSSRLRIVRLLESLVLLGDPSVDALLCESNCLEICLDLFWKFQWCSMLHQSVANLLVHVFEGANARSELQSYFMVKCNLLGRLMDSFWEAAEDGSTAGRAGSEVGISEAVMAMKGIDGISVPTSVGSERDSVNSYEEGVKEDAIPVSDDDVDAALEQQESEGATNPPVNTASAERSTEQEATGAAAPESQDLVTKPSEPMPAQSFRLGYMGHVIIICQALVHACSNDGGSEGEGPSVAGGGSVSLTGTSNGEPRGEGNGELEAFVAKNNSDDQESLPQEGSAQYALECARAADSVYTEETPSNPLMLAQLVESHVLQSKWQDFVTTTLASETAIQSTPLGGFAGGPGMDPLHSHRPGLAEEGEYDNDDGAAPPLPPRGLLVGGDVIDMDDNDLDIAASMMAGLSMGRGGGDDNNQNEGSPDMLAQIPRQGESSQPGGYIFDDPLGNNRYGNFDGDDDDDDSSDEESGTTRDSGDSGGNVVEGVSYGQPGSGSSDEDDAPVMDLFAGNLDPFDKQDPGSGDQGTWSNFANFDDAFAGADGGANPFDNNTSAEEPATEAPSGDMEKADDVFGYVKDHAILLDDAETPEIEKETPEMDAEETIATEVKAVGGEEPVAEDVEGGAETAEAFDTTTTSD